MSFPGLQYSKDHWEPYMFNLPPFTGTKYKVYRWEITLHLNYGFCDGHDLLYCLFLIAYFVSSNTVSQAKPCGARRFCHQSDQLSTKGQKVPKAKRDGRAGSAKGRRTYATRHCRRNKINKDQRGFRIFFIPESHVVVEIKHGMNEEFDCKDSLYMARVILKPCLYCFA